jgi:uncharacterized Tic20 family protein
MKERNIIISVILILASLGLIAITRSTDVIYVAVGLAFFGLCIAYAEWCEQL